MHHNFTHRWHFDLHPAPENDAKAFCNLKRLNTNLLNCSVLVHITSLQHSHESGFTWAQVHGFFASLAYASNFPLFVPELYNTFDTTRKIESWKIHRIKLWLVGRHKSPRRHNPSIIRLFSSIVMAQFVEAFRLTIKKLRISITLECPFNLPSSVRITICHRQ